VTTPSESPSDAYMVGRLATPMMVFIPRQGRGHKILPTRINYRANGPRHEELGVEWILSRLGGRLDEGGDSPGHIVDRRSVHDRTKAR